jgi:hypothetical protein
MSRGGAHSASSKTNRSNYNIFSATVKLNEQLNEQLNELPRRKQRGINSLQPLLNHAASCGELNPRTRIKAKLENRLFLQRVINGKVRWT